MSWAASRSSILGPLGRSLLQLGGCERPIPPQSGVRASPVSALPPCPERKQGYPHNRTDHLLQQPDILTC